MICYAIYDLMTAKLHHFTGSSEVLAKDAVMSYMEICKSGFEVNNEDYWRDSLVHLSEAKDVQDLIARASEIDLVLSVLPV